MSQPERTVASEPVDPADLPQSVPGTHLVTGDFQPRPPNAPAPGPRYNDGPVSRMLALRNGQLGWRKIPEPMPEMIPTEEKP